MPTHYTYLLVNIGALIIPLIFSFHPKLNFHLKWKSALPSILIIALLFILWDIRYTDMGVWGFNPDYLIGINIYNLPLEEVLFFICIPYACLFTYHCFKLIEKDNKVIPIKLVSSMLIISFMVISIVYYSNWYTSVTFLLLGIFLLFVQFYVNPKWLPRLYFTLLVLLIPFLIVNGILTGTGLTNPVVWYNQSEIIGIRILTIPVEDIFYGFLLILLNVYCFEEVFLKKTAE